MSEKKNDKKIILRAKKRIEILRRVHGLKQSNMYDAMGFTKQYYHQGFLATPNLSARALMGITKLFNVTPQDLLEVSDKEFKELPIFKAYQAYVKATNEFETLQIGIRKAPLDIDLEEVIE